MLGQTITNIRAGKNITLETLNKICEMYGLQSGDLIGFYSITYLPAEVRS